MIGPHRKHSKLDNSASPSGSCFVNTTLSDFDVVLRSSVIYKIKSPSVFIPGISTHGIASCPTEILGLTVVYHRLSCRGVVGMPHRGVFRLLCFVSCYLHKCQNPGIRRNILRCRKILRVSDWYVLMTKLLTHSVIWPHWGLVGIKPASRVPERWRKRLYKGLGRCSVE